jgi:hypothetical protein
MKVLVGHRERLHLVNSGVELRNLLGGVVASQYKIASNVELLRG